MKKLVKVSVILLGLTLSVQAQAQMKLGVKTGLNFASISAEDNSDVKMRLAYQLGVIADYTITDELSLQPGLLLSSKGCSFDIEGDGYSRMAFNYLEVPLNFAYKINDFQVFAGPYLAYGISGKAKWSDGDDKDSEKYNLVIGKVDSESYDNDFNALDYGLSIGAGYQAGPVLLHLGYSLGLGNLMPKIKGNEDYAKDNKMQHRVLSLSASYFFGE